MNLKYMKVSLFEISYKKKTTLSRHSNLLRCTCIFNNVCPPKRFSQLKNARCSFENSQLAALENALVAQRFSSRDALVAMKWNIHGCNMLLVSHFEDYYRI